MDKEVNTEMMSVNNRGERNTGYHWSREDYRLSLGVTMSIYKVTGVIVVIHKVM